MKLTKTQIIFDFCPTGRRDIAVVKSDDKINQKKFKLKLSFDLNNTICNECS